MPPYLEWTPLCTTEDATEGRFKHQSASQRPSYS
uniref:Uncharacterized protein n=1 Tax=Anguilla anguilla TaxID=7936 RepID=A0A0E9SSA0_ANGAN